MTGKPQTIRVLVTGSTGKVGQMLLRHWKKTHPDGVKPVPLDRAGVRQILAEQNPESADVVLALWGVTPGSGRDLSQNATLAAKAMDLARRTGAARVLHCSSAAVYRPGPEPLTETTLPDPGNAYGLAKLEMEREIARRVGGPRSCVMRIGNVVGADSLFASLKSGGAITLDQFDDGISPSRSYIAVSDLADICLALAMCPLDTLPAVVNVAAPVPTEMAEICHAAGAQIKFAPAGPQASRVVWLDTSRLSRIRTLMPHSADPDFLVADWRESGGRS